MIKLFGTAASLVILCLIISVGPALVLWSANTISEQAALGWYIPHNWMTYCSTIALLIAFRGGK